MNGRRNGASSVIGRRSDFLMTRVRAAVCYNDLQIQRHFLSAIGRRCSDVMTRNGLSL